MAGPGPADGFDAGTVWIGREDGRATLFLFPGGREDIRESSVLAALYILAEMELPEKLAKFRQKIENWKIVSWRSRPFWLIGNKYREYLVELGDDNGNTNRRKPENQTEIIRPRDMGASKSSNLYSFVVNSAMSCGHTASARAARYARCLRTHAYRSATFRKLSVAEKEASSELLLSITQALQRPPRPRASPRS